MAYWTGIKGFNLPALGFTGTSPSNFTLAAFQAMHPSTQLTYLKARGVDFVRLPFDTTPFLANSDTTVTSLASVVTSVVDYVLGYNLKVIVDFHVGGGGVAGWTPTDIEASWVKLQRLFKIESVVADALKNYDNTKVCLELYNEAAMNAGGVWPAIMWDLYQNAHTYAPNLTLLLSPAYFADPASISEVNPNWFGGNTMFVIHDYNPQQFTYQGIPSGPVSNLTGMKWPADTSQTAALKSGQNAQVQGYIDGFMSACQNASTYMTSDIKPVTDWKVLYSVPQSRIIFTEIGCSIYVDSTSRASYLKSRVDSLRANNFAVCGWCIQPAWTGTEDVFNLMRGGTNGTAFEPSIITAFGLTP